MAAVENSTLVSTKEVDYLDEDKPIRGQNFVLLSFLSPEDVIVNKEAYIFTKFIEKFSDDMKKLLEGIKEKNPEQKDMVDTIADNHSYIFEPKEMNEQLAFLNQLRMTSLKPLITRIITLLLLCAVLKFVVPLILLKRQKSVASF